MQRHPDKVVRKLSPALPGELWAMITEIVAESHPWILKECASVCQDLRPWAQHYTLSRIRLGGNKGFREWSSHVEHTTLSSFVTRIHYYKIGNDQPCRLESNKCIGYLTKIHGLWLDGANLYNMPDFAVLGPAIRVLELHNCQAFTDDLLTFIRHFTQLEVLAISRLTLPGRRSSVKQDMRSPPVAGDSLRKVALLPGNTFILHAMGWMELFHFLVYSGSKLNMIRIHSDWGPFNLTLMHELTWVGFDGPDVHKNLATLRTISSNKLATLQFTIPDHYFTSPQLAEWNSLDRAFRNLLVETECDRLRFCARVRSLTDRRDQILPWLLQWLPRFTDFTRSEGKVVTIELEDAGEFPVSVGLPDAQQSMIDSKTWG